MGYKTWAADEILTAEDVNDLLMRQTVPRVDLAGRNAIPAPVVGMVVARTDKGGRFDRYTTAGWRLDPKEQWGIANVPGATITAGGLTSYAVEFPEAFDSAPDIQLTLRSAQGGTANLDPRAGLITASGFSVYVFNQGTTSATWTGSLVVGWRAIA